MCYNYLISVCQATRRVRKEGKRIRRGTYQTCGNSEKATNRRREKKIEKRTKKATHIGKARAGTQRKNHD